MRREMEVDESGTFITSTVFDSSSEFDIPLKLHIYKIANRIDNKNQTRATKSFGTFTTTTTTTSIFYNREAQQAYKQTSSLTSSKTSVPLEKKEVGLESHTHNCTWYSLVYCA